MEQGTILDSRERQSRMGWRCRCWRSFRSSLEAELRFTARTRRPRLRGYSLVHPAGFRSAIFLVHVLGRDVVAIFVEGPTHGAILFAHEYFKLARRTAPLPAVIR